VGLRPSPSPPQGSTDMQSYLFGPPILASQLNKRIDGTSQAGESAAACSGVSMVPTRGCAVFHLARATDRPSGEACADEALTLIGPRARGRGPKCKWAAGSPATVAGPLLCGCLPL